jgi:urease accessory protein
MSMSQATRIEVRRLDGRLTCTFLGGHLSARRVGAPEGRVRVALVGTVALLLAGDAVRIEVVVGRGVDLEIVEVAGTVAYDMRGGSAEWQVDVHVEDGGVLVWEGLPFVIADGADVTRTMTVVLDGSACAALRETYVFGRTGEAGGDLRTSTVIAHDDRPLLVEQLDLRAGARIDGAILGTARCFDAVTSLGARIETARPGLLQLESAGSIDRRLAESLHTTGLSQTFRDATAVIRRRNMASSASSSQSEPTGLSVLQTRSSTHRPSRRLPAE